MFCTEASVQMHLKDAAFILFTKKFGCLKKLHAVQDSHSLSTRFLFHNHRILQSVYSIIYGKRLKSRK